MRAPSERRLWGALAFSLVVIPGLVGVSVLASRPSQHNVGPVAALTVGLALAVTLAVWTLVASLLTVRPALKHPLGRWVWIWTFACCAVLAYVGLAHPTTTMESWLLYACGLLALFWGLPGLVIAAIPPRARRDFYGRKM